jgi:erythromycin esterase
MPFKNLFMVVALFLSVVMPLGVLAQTDLVAAINSKLIPLKTITPNNDFSDLQPLKKILKDKKIIGLGESAHGVHDFFVFKLRLLQFLVKEMGVKTLLTETDFAGTQAMNDYVLNGIGDANKIIAEVGGGVWGTQEFVQMLQWVKSYNDTRAEKLKISIYGFDMTKGSSTAKLLQSYLVSTKQTTPVLQQVFDAMIKGGRLTDDERLSIKNAIGELKAIQFNHPGDDTKMYKHLVTVTEQYADYIAPAATADPNEKNNLRDKNMAENIEWLYHYTNDSKMAIWSHSEHLSKTINSSGVARAGIYLNEAFKNDYYLLGLCFNSGKIKSQPSAGNPAGIYDIPEVTMPNNSDALFAQCKSPNFMLDFKTASVNPVIKDYLNTTVSSYFIGSNYAAKAGTDQMYVQHKWNEGYDGIVFIKNVGAATAIRQ